MADGRVRRAKGHSRFTVLAQRHFAMSWHLSLVLVTYRSSSAASAALASFRAEATALGLASEVVIVDHSEDESELERLQALAPTRLIARPNAGYAAGVNAGISLSSGRILLVANPDIVFGRGSLSPLLDALQRGWDVVGPQFGLAGWLLPPADLQTPGELCQRWLAGRVPAFWRFQLRNEITRWRTVWEASEVVRVPTLSGALLAFQREVFLRVGPWDEGFFLYFEETEWLRRAGDAGLRLGQVPMSLVEHSWGHAADPRALGAVLLASRGRYFDRRFGLWGRLATSLPPITERFGNLPRFDGVRSNHEGDVLWLLSPSLLGFPAAGRYSCGSPLEAIAAFHRTHNRPQTMSLHAVDTRTGLLLGSWRCEPEVQRRDT